MHNKVLIGVRAASSDESVRVILVARQRGLLTGYLGEVCFDQLPKYPVLSTKYYDVALTLRSTVPSCSKLNVYWVTFERIYFTFSLIHYYFVQYGNDS